MGSLKMEFRRDNKSRSHLGFTLIELLVTMLILTIGLLGTAGLTTGIIRGNFFAKNITSATAIAETQLEAVQREGYVNATTTNFPSTPIFITMGNVNFKRTTTIANDDPADNMKKITVLVEWDEANNAARSVTLETIMAE